MPKNRHKHLAQNHRHNRANFRELDRAKRTTQEQLILLEKRPGNSLREITRLRSEIQYVVPSSIHYRDREGFTTTPLVYPVP